jgi:hypothetical protein
MRPDGQQRARPLSVVPRRCTETTPPVDLESGRARTAALVEMSLLFQRDFGPNTPGPRPSKNRQALARAVSFCDEESDVENSTLSPT